MRTKKDVPDYQAHPKIFYPLDIAITIDTTAMNTESYGHRLIFLLIIIRIIDTLHEDFTIAYLISHCLFQ